jgi:hypothetical protein
MDARLTSWPHAAEVKLMEMHKKYSRGSSTYEALTADYRSWRGCSWGITPEYCAEVHKFTVTIRRNHSVAQASSSLANACSYCKPTAPDRCLSLLVESLRFAGRRRPCVGYTLAEVCWEFPPRPHSQAVQCLPPISHEHTINVFCRTLNGHARVLTMHE